MQWNEKSMQNCIKEWRETRNSLRRRLEESRLCKELFFSLGLKSRRREERNIHLNLHGNEKLMKCMMESSTNTTSAKNEIWHQDSRERNEERRRKMHWICSASFKTRFLLEFPGQVSHMLSFRNSHFLPTLLCRGMCLISLFAWRCISSTFDDDQTPFVYLESVNSVELQTPCLWQAFFAIIDTLSRNAAGINSFFFFQSNLSRQHITRCKSRFHDLYDFRDEFWVKKYKEKLYSLQRRQQTFA